MIPKVSVIVPVYKAEAYLHRCVDSLLSQTFHDFEILLIDDGSPDKSGKICDEYAAKDDRVRVFHKENGGVSSARQCGIDNALGEYTIHADPDDWVEPNMLEELYTKAETDNVDMVICDYWEDVNGVRKLIIQENVNYEKQQLLNAFLFQQLHGSCCNKLVKRTCYNTVSFPKGLNYSEDTYVMMHIINEGIKVSYLNKAFYHYCIDTNPNSIMKSSKRNLFYQGLKFVELIKKICPVSEYREGYAVQYADLAVRAFCCNIYSTEELLDITEGWNEDFHFKKRLSPLWRMLFFMATKLRMYKFLYALIEFKRNI